MKKHTLFFLIFLCSCGATRKLSKVDIRSPSSMRERSVVSEVRQRASSYKTMPKRCPLAIQQTFSYLAGELIKFPACPQELDQIQNSIPYLNLEERTTLEEVIGSQCQSIARGQFSDSLENILSNFNSTGPKGRRGNDPNSNAILDRLKIGIENTVRIHLPLDRWVERNGDFLFPEEDLAYMDKLFMGQQCKLTDQEVDQTYRTMRALEDLSNIIPEGEQKKSIELFLDGVHNLIDQRVKEYFYP